MDGSSRILSPMFKLARSKFLARTVLLSSVIFALSLGNPQMPPVSAELVAQDAGVSVSDTYSVVEEELPSLPRSPYCVGQSYGIFIVPRPTREYTMGGKPLGKGYTNALPEVFVDATTTDSTVGNVQPETRMFTAWSSEDFPAVFEYTFQAKAPGRTSIILEYTIPAEMTGTGAPERYHPEPRDIEVVDCAYQVSMSWSMVLEARGGAYSHHSPKGSGQIKPTTIKWNATTGQYEGEADHRFTWIWKSHLPPSADTTLYCSLDGHPQHNTNTITAERDRGVLTLKFQPERFISFNYTEVCFGRGIPVSPDMDVARFGTGTVFPAATGATVKRHPLFPSKNLRMIIQVTPIRPSP